ncbi:MAG: type II toxin-antitoxin system HicA family toxin [Oscillospiraceae bacterium]
MRGEENDLWGVKKFLKKNGCVFDHDGKRHEMWYSPMTMKKFPIGRHNSQEVFSGTYNAIMKQAGIK